MVRLERLFISDSDASVCGNRYRSCGGDIASLLGQMRYSTKNVMTAPSDYRQWVVVGSSTGSEHSKSGHVYMNPAAYREYEQSHKFPEGTVIVLETRAAGTNRLQMSVKDSARSQTDGGFSISQLQQKSRSRYHRPLVVYLASG
jgi:hypothetical protein